MEPEEGEEDTAESLTDKTCKGRNVKGGGRADDL